jgi:excisionase family DNA binding protein
MKQKIQSSGLLQSVKLFSIEEVKDSLSVSRPTVNRLISAGILRTCRIGRAVRIPESALLDLIERGGHRNIALEVRK